MGNLGWRSGLGTNAMHVLARVTGWPEALGTLALGIEARLNHVVVSDREVLGN